MTMKSTVFLDFHKAHTDASRAFDFWNAYTRHKIHLLTETAGAMEIKRDKGTYNCVNLHLVLVVFLFLIVYRLIEFGPHVHATNPM